MGFIEMLIAMIRGYDDDTINHEIERRKQNFHPKACNSKETFTFFNPARNASNDPSKELRDYSSHIDK